MSRIIILLILLPVFGCKLSAYEFQDIANDKFFELSFYGNLSTIGKNLNVQTDIGTGINFLKYLNTTFTFNFNYRNYCLLTNDFLSISGGTSFLQHEIRIGVVSGVYTVRLSGYHHLFPCIGGEFLYCYNVSKSVSIRLKERVVGYREDSNRIFSSSTLLGLCILF